MDTVSAEVKRNALLLQNSLLYSMMKQSYFLDESRRIEGLAMQKMMTLGGFRIRPRKEADLSNCIKQDHHE